MNWLSRLLRRLAYISKATLTTRDSRLFVARDAVIRAHKSSETAITGRLSLGNSLHDGVSFAGRCGTNLYLGPGAKLLVEGDVSIGNGCSIIVGKGATLKLSGPLTIAHDCTILCNLGIEIGANSVISWGVTLIDNDLHDPVFKNGKVLKRPRNKLVIGERVGIQSAVIVPAGVNIGHDCVISAGTVLRHSVDPECFVYSNPELKVRKGLKSGLPWK